MGFWESFIKWWQDLGTSLHDWLLVPNENTNMNFLTRFLLALIVLILGSYLIKLIMKISRKLSGVKTQVGVDVSVKTFSLAVIKLFLNVFLAIIFLLILGVDLTSMATVISSATVAIGLSLQDLISAFASGVVLLKSKHFRTGDYIRIDHSNGSCEGTVSSVGLITCTLETFENQHVVIPNNQVLQGVVTNYSTNPTRRLTLDINVDLNTDVERCKAVMLDVVKNDKRILTSPVPFAALYNFTDYSITMRLVCYTKREVYWDVFYSIKENMLIAYKKNNIKIPVRKFIVQDN